IGPLDPAPMRGRKAHLSGRMIIKEVNRRANAAVRDAVAEFADFPCHREFSGESAQFFPTGSFQFVSLHGFAARKFPEMRQETFGGATTQQKLVAVTNNRQWPSHSADGSCASLLRHCG